MRMFLLLFSIVFSTNLQAENPVWKEGVTEKPYDITVYRSASCGCCSGWIKHLKDHHFNVNDMKVDDVNPYKERYGVPPKAASCHTAVVKGITIEGHVPAQDIKELLQANSEIRLLTVPGMPSGTPGMDMPGAPKDDFNVYSLDKNNNVGIYKKYYAKEY